MVNDGDRVMKFELFDDDDEYKSDGFVEISKRFAMQSLFSFFGRELFDTVYLQNLCISDIITSVEGLKHELML